MDGRFMATKQLEAKLIYERASRWSPHGLPTTLRLWQTDNNEKYPFPMITLEIDQLVPCQECKGLTFAKPRIAFSIEDQLAMWESIFKVIVHPHEKEKKLKLLEDLIKKLRQMPLFNEEVPQ